jgi:hypothetical protein
MTRWKAAFIHLSISALIGVTVASLFFLVWYPPPYFQAAGADELVVLLVGIDLCLGPFLTVIVFRSGKRGLKFDLTIIGTIQLAAFVYGLVVILESRPIFLVAVVDRFDLVSSNEISDADLADGREDIFRSRSWSGPRLVAVEMPTDAKERDALTSSALRGRDAQNLPKYYRTFAQAGPLLLKRAKTIDALVARKSKNQQIVESALNDLRRTKLNTVWVPLEARKRDMVMLLDSHTAQPLSVIAIDPW